MNAEDLRCLQRIVFAERRTQAGRLELGLELEALSGCFPTVTHCGVTA